MTESKIPIHKCRPRGATLCKVRSLKLRQHRQRRYFLRYKKRVYDGIKGSYTQMSPERGDAL